MRDFMFEDEDGQVLVEVWTDDDGCVLDVDVMRRSDSAGVWGPPMDEAKENT